MPLPVARGDLIARSDGALDAVDTWVAGSLAIEGDDTEAVGQMTTAIDGLLGIRL